MKRGEGRRKMSKSKKYAQFVMEAAEVIKVEDKELLDALARSPD